MENFFIFNGMDSREYGIKCSSPPIVLPKRNYKKITVPGRSGRLLIDENSYAPVYKTIRCRIYSSSKLSAFLSGLREKGRLILSSEPLKYYVAYVSQSISAEYVLEDYRAFDITFCCDPFKYSVEEAEDSLTAESTPFEFYGKGTVSALPFIKIYGSGNMNLHVNGNFIELKNIAEYVSLDSRHMSCMKENINMNMNMTGNYPVFLGEGNRNIISYSGNIIRMEIEPNWRWI